MIKDDSGQVLLLMSIIICIGLVVLLVFLNQSSMGGHSSSDSIISFPKNDIRDIRDETAGEASIIGSALNANASATNSTVNATQFNSSFAMYAGDLSRMYAMKGSVVDVNCTPAVNVNNTRIINATVMIYYNDGETSYDETAIVDIA